MLLCGQALAQFYGNYPPINIDKTSRVAKRDAGAEVRVDQKLKEFVPLDLQFVSDDGKDVKLRSLVKDRPVVLLPIFYKCPGICETELYNMVDSLKGFKRENSKLAQVKKDTVISAYMSGSVDKQKRLNAEKGFHLLTSNKETLDKLSDAIGFRFRYDDKGNIVHPACLVVLTPAGKISRYFVDTEYPQHLLLQGIRDASQELVGPTDDRPFFLACVQIDPLTGSRTLNILNTLKTLGVCTVFGLLLSIVVWNRKHKAGGGDLA
jgi:protein SCO1/2